MGDNIFPKRRNWHSGTNYIFLPSHFCICLEMQRRIAIVAIWNNCDRSVLSVLVVPVHQNRTHKLMHHAFKTWCIVSTSGRFSKSPLISQEISGFSLFSELFEGAFSGAVWADPYRDPYGNESRLRNSKPGFQNSENPVLVKIIFCYPASTTPMVSAAFFCAAVVTWA